MQINCSRPTGTVTYSTVRIQSHPFLRVDILPNVFLLAIPGKQHFSFFFPPNICFGFMATLSVTCPLLFVDEEASPETATTAGATELPKARPR